MGPQRDQLDGTSADETCSHLKFKGQVWAHPDESTHTWSLNFLKIMDENKISDSLNKQFDEFDEFDEYLIN